MPFSLKRGQPTSFHQQGRGSSSSPLKKDTNLSYLLQGREYSACWV
jgi:hypothetical protein